MLNIEKIEKALSTKEKDSRQYNILINRLVKKHKKIKRYMEIRTNEKSLEYKKQLEENNQIFKLNNLKKSFKLQIR